MAESREDIQRELEYWIGHRGEWEYCRNCLCWWQAGSTPQHSSPCVVATAQAAIRVMEDAGERARKALMEAGDAQG